MLTLLLGTDWTANRREVLSRLAEDVRLRRSNRILLVPELISHETERQLCATAGATASRYAEVLSFSRLVRRVSEELDLPNQPCLDAGGRLVAMAASARQLSSRLKSYAAVETRPEFLSSLVEIVDEFKRCCISTQDLQAASQQSEGTLAQKLEELALLMEGYDSLCCRGKRDPRDQLTWLLEQMEQGSFGTNHTVYIDGFPDFTRQHLAVLEHLIRVADQVTVSLNCDAPGSGLLAFEKAGDTASQLLRCAGKAGVEVRLERIAPRQSPLTQVREGLFQGPIVRGCAEGSLFALRTGEVWQECLAAAEQVLQLVRSGCRYRDITLVTTDMAAYRNQLELIFNRMHIPLYQSGTESILGKSVIATVLTALDTALDGFEQRSFLRYLRSALSPLKPDECDLVENYAVIWGIRGAKWVKPWEYHPEGLTDNWLERDREALARLNRLRALAVEPLEKLRQGFREAGDLRAQVQALYGFLEDIHLQRQLDDMALSLDQAGDNREAQILNQLWDLLISALEQLYDVLGETHWEGEHFSRLLKLLLSQYDVGTIPPVLDAVQFGPISAMRCHEQKHLLLLGAKEGSLPGYPGSTGVLTDQERVALRSLGVPLTGGAMEGIQAEFAEIYGVFCGAMESIRVFCSGPQPSFVFRRLGEMAGSEQELQPGLDYALADPWEAGAWLARWDAEGAARELGVEEAFRDVCRRRAYCLGKVSQERIRTLYGKALKLSASQIDRQAECRLSYFLRYGIAARERKEITVDPAEFGTYVHWVLEHTVRDIRELGGFSEVSLEKTLELAHHYSEEYAASRFSQLDSQRVAYLFRRNLRELDMVVQELWSELRQAAFRPEQFELYFGKEGSLPGVDIPNAAMPAQLQGYVDRVDVWASPGSTYYRIVDYKTGRKDFDYCDVFHGVGLQLLLYLFALRSGGEGLLGAHPVPAGVQYFPARVPYLSGDGAMEAEEAEARRIDHFRRPGLLLADKQVLQAMEPGEDIRRMSYRIRPDGSLTGDLADREQFRLLSGYVFHVVGAMVEDIASGNVEPNPYTRGSAHSACDYCPYGAVCHKAQVSGRRNFKAMKADWFWTEVKRKEADSHGR